MTAKIEKLISQVITALYKLSSGIHFDALSNELCLLRSDGNLKMDGNDFNRFYYLDVSEDGKSNITADNRDYLKNEYIIIGMLFLKMFRLDGNIELDSSEFTTLLYEEYEEEKNALRKLINDNASDKGSDLSDQRFEDVVKKAFTKFAELGWIMWEDPAAKNHFKVMPSFERLRNAYRPQIETIDELIREYNDAK